MVGISNLLGLLQQSNLKQAKYNHYMIITVRACTHIKDTISVNHKSTNFDDITVSAFYHNSEFV